MQVVKPINLLLDSVPFTMHCYSLDWHPSDHVSFIDNCHMRALHQDSKVGTLQPLLRVTLPTVLGAQP